jgi:hypothetical protein
VVVDSIHYGYSFDMSSAEKASKSLSDKFANLGKGEKIKLQDIDAVKFSKFIFYPTGVIFRNMKHVTKK